MKTANIKKELKLFIWNDFNHDYSRGLAFAIAKDETDAKKTNRERNRVCG